MMKKFPFTNLIGQLLKHMTQPLSQVIVKHVEKWPFLRKYVFVPLGRFHYLYEDKMKHQKIPAIAKVKPVNKAHMTEEGTKLLIKIIFFGLLWSVVMYKTRKAAKISRITEQLWVQKLNDLEAEKDQLVQRVEDQTILTKRLKDIIVDYSRQVDCILTHDLQEKEGE